MPDAAYYLTLARDQAAQRLSELDAVPISERVTATYTSKTGQTVDWNGYRRELLETIKELSEGLIQKSSSTPAFEVWG